MNQVGIHALVWVEAWSAPECEFAIASSHEAGYDLIEFPVFEPTELDIGAITRSLREHELGVT